MTISFKHKTLCSTLDGVELPWGLHFRGIPYGRVPARFEKPEAMAEYPTRLDCTHYGPRCPQVPVDVGHLLRIPADHVFPLEHEDEFNCLNLDVALPKDALSAEQGLPVMILTSPSGGSQAVTFGSAASGICDPSVIVRDSVTLKKSVIVVSVQYRLNIFALGLETGPVNLALRDQLVALEWVQQHIAGFGGDPDKITLAGESAGAVYCHAHLSMKAPARQFILSSGSLYLSPPQPKERASMLRGAVEKHLLELGNFDLLSAPVNKLVEAVERSGIQSWFLQTDSRLENWQSTTGIARALLLSDTQVESIIWQRGIWAADPVDIVKAFDAAGAHADKLKRSYNIYPHRASSTKIGALDFINDVRFVLPIEKLVQLWRGEQKSVFRCLLDEPNPWQPSNGAHHAVDLIFLFGGFDLSFSPAASLSSKKIREKWLDFMHLNDPWDSNGYVAFGPHGSFRELDYNEIKSRRRMTQIEYLKEMDASLLDRVFMALAAGRISLLN